MKKIILSLSFVLCICLNAFSQHVSYTYKPLAAKGCNVRYSAIYQDSIAYLFVEVRSDRLVFGSDPNIKLKTFEGDIITLEGKSLAASEEHGGVVIGNIVTPVTEINAKAQFQITQEQINLLNKGVSKVRINTMPLTHEREFKSDKIGKKLFKLFEKAKKKQIEF